MRRWFVAAGLLMVSLVTAAGDANAGEYQSGFGFRISVPNVWLVLTRTEMARSAEVFLGSSGAHSGLGAVPLKMRRAVYDRVQAGELEIFYRREGSSDSFIDNVNVLMQRTTLPLSADHLAAICLVMPTEFSRVFGRPISMDVCEMRERVSRPALYLQFDGAILGTTTLQYQFQLNPGETLILTATAAIENIPRMLGEFEEMISSIRIQ